MELRAAGKDPLYTVGGERLTAPATDAGTGGGTCPDPLAEGPDQYDSQEGSLGESFLPGEPV